MISTKLSTLLFWGALTSVLSAQPCSLLQDIGNKFGDPRSEVNHLTVSNGKLFFTAWSPLGPPFGMYKLYATDGTAPGTGVVREILPFQSLLDQSPTASPISFQGKLFFLIGENNQRSEIWTSDGTPSGTQPFFETNPLWASRLYPAASYLSFLAFQGSSSSLWRTDGTPGGTSLLKNFSLGINEPAYSQQRAALADLTFLQINATQLWRTDGTPGGTFLLRDFPEVNMHPVRMNAFVIYNNQLFFTVQSDFSIDLWRSDGTVSGTQQVLKLSSSSAFSEMPEVTAVANGLLFITRAISKEVSELWVSDGTTAGTFKLTNAVVYSDELNQAPRLAVANNRLFFSGGEALGITDGSESGTFSVQTIGGQRVCCLSDGLTGEIYFVRKSDSGVLTLWKSDGSGPNTQSVNTLAQSNTVLPGEWTWFDGNLYFVHDNTSGGQERELWRTDGTPGGTGLFADFSAKQGSSQPFSFTAGGARCFFLTNNGRWASDGEPVSTVQWSNDATAWDNMIAVAPNRAYFVDGNQDVYRTDGTAAGTVPLVVPGGGDYQFEELPFFSNAAKSIMLVNSHEPLGTQNHLFRLPEQGTNMELVKTFPSVFGAYSLIFYGERNGKLLFTASDDDTGNSRSLWETDGTTAGTKLLFGPVPWYEAIWGTDDRYIPHAGTNGKIVFLADHQIWVTDGTAGGTSRLNDDLTSFGFLNSRHSNELTVFQSDVFLPAQLNFESDSAQLWRTDGTEAGTSLAVTGNTGVQYPRAAAQQLFFLASDHTHGRELWRTDGTTSGTWLVKDIWPGSRSTPIIPLAVYNNYLFFSAQDAEHGAELWISDGTDSGTYLVQDINPGPEGSNGGLLFGLSPETAVAGNKLFFPAYHPNSGVEPWVFDLSTVTVLEPPAAALSLLLKPNPANGSTFLQVDSPASGNLLLQIFQTDGRLVKTWNAVVSSGKQTLPVDLANLPAGLYVLRAKSATGGLASVKLVVR